MTAITDRFAKVGTGTVTSLQAPGKALAATSINIGSATNWPTDTAVFFAIRKVDPTLVTTANPSGQVSGSYTIWKGTVAGTVISNLALQSGGAADQVYAAGTNTQVFIDVSSAQLNALIDGILVQHTQLGAHTGITTDTLTVTSGTTLPAGDIGTADLANATVTPSKLATGAQSALVVTSEATASTTYVDLTTTTDSVTVTIGANGLALVVLSATSNESAGAATTFMSFAASGTNTIAAADAHSLQQGSISGIGNFQASWTYLATGLTAGSTTFKAKYRVSTGTGTFSNRNIAVIPL